jgi:multiple antibiotic resistance protein
VQDLVETSLAAFAALFSIVNPLGGLAVFFALTSNDSERDRNAAALRVTLYFIAILLTFAVLGTFILKFFGITLPALRIAGGLIVAHTAWNMVTASSRMTPSESAEASQKTDISFAPMAMPMLAGPGAIGVVMAMTERNDPTHAWYAAAIIAVIANGIVVYALLRLGAPLAKRMGPGILGAIDRILGFLILAIAIQLIITGLLGLDPFLHD